MIETERLVLRQWRDADRDPWAAMNADAEVMEFFPSTLTREQADGFVDHVAAHIDRHGWGLFATEVRASGDFIGFVGLAPASFEAHFTPAVEIGWRLTRAAWGSGYATEAARAVLDMGFRELGLDEIVSFTAVDNLPSRAVMQRIGLRHDPADDFDHPKLAPGHRLRRHVLYRLENPQIATS